MWQGFCSAIQFLTLLPCGSPARFDARKALPYFPLCGLMIGGLLVVVDWAARHAWDTPTVALLDLAVLAAVSGALHLDGLADTADGLYGRRTPEKALAIMKDSRIGAMGMVVVVFCLALKWAGLAGVQTHRWLYLLIVPAYGRCAILFAVHALPYGRPEGGTGQSFFQPPLTIRDFWGLPLLLLITLPLGWAAVPVIVAFGLVVPGLLTFFRSRVGCVTGDMLGAMIEICETALLLVASVRWPA